jgi:hypothetical protein
MWIRGEAQALELPACFFRIRLLAFFLNCLIPSFLLGCSGGGSNSTPPSTIPDSKTGITSPAIFREVTAESGLQFTYRNGEDADHCAILESIGGGVGLIDYNRDGRLDIFVTGGGHFGSNKEILGYANRLFRNEGNWRFRDVTAEVGLPTDDGPCFSHAVAVGDYDNDGWPDVLVTGYGRLALYHNERGRFRDVTSTAGLRDQRELHWSTGAGWGDFNGDGLLDLYVAHYLDWSWKNHPRCGTTKPEQPSEICHPSVFKPLQHALFVNQGSETFREMTEEAGLRPGKGLGVLVTDLNDDGRPDVYVANDTNFNFLLLNQTDKRSGKVQFEEVAERRGAAGSEGRKPDGSMGIDAGDYDGSGRLSLFVTNFIDEMHALYRPLASGQYAHASVRAGINAIGLKYSGFGTSFVDWDRDGWEDIVISNGNVARRPPPPVSRSQFPVLLQSLGLPRDREGPVRFEAVTERGGPYFQQLHMGRGLACGDLDDDGRIDLVLSHLNEPVAILRNELDNGAHWLGIGLIGKPNRDAVGAKVTLEVGDRKLLKVIKNGGSYFSASDARLLFGLGQDARVGRLTVRWPSGQIQTWEALTPDRYWYLVEGEVEPHSTQLAP